MSKFGVIGFFLLSLFMWSCAGDGTSADSDSTESNADSYRVDIERDEEGTPLPCSVISNQLLADQVANFASSDRVPEKLDQANAQSCSISLLQENGLKLGEIRLIVNPMEARPDREAIAKRAKNTQYVDDLPVPAMYRQLSTLTTVIFDHGLHTYNLNVNLLNQGNQAQYELARNIAIQITESVEEE